MGMGDPSSSTSSRRSTSKVDNQVYDRYGRLWWEDNGCGAMSSIRFLVNPIRFAFFKRIAEGLFGCNLQDCSFLDVGCGGGFLTEEFCRLGLSVTGIDASHNSVNNSKSTRRAGKTGRRTGPHKLRARFRRTTSFKETLLFDLVACCDVLEHVADPRTVYRRDFAGLKPGGSFFTRRSTEPSSVGS